MTHRPIPPLPGVLGLLVLSVLAVKGEAHGYEIMKSIEEITEGKWRPAPGSLYPLLMSLESEGLIECWSVGEGRVRKVCRLTQEGIRYFIEEVGRRFARIAPLTIAVLNSLKYLIERERLVNDYYDVIDDICNYLSKLIRCSSDLCSKASRTSYAR